MAWQPVDQELFQKLLSCVNDRDKKLLEYVYTHRICKLSTLSEKIQSGDDTLENLLTVIGGVNGKIFKRYNCAIFPKHPAHTLKDSTYSLGFME